MWYSSDEKGVQELLDSGQGEEVLFAGSKGQVEEEDGIQQQVERMQQVCAQLDCI